MSDPASSPPVGFTRAGIRRGFLLGQPLAPGTALYAVVFGVLASQNGLSALESVLMSVFVFSGSAQLAALQGWSSSPLVLPLAATILVINARYVLYGAAIQPWLVRATRPQAIGSLWLLGDGSWAISMKEYHAGYRDAGLVLGTGLATFLPWVLGTVAGYLLSSSVPSPATFGLDFMLVAFAAAIGISMWRGRQDLAPALAAAGVAWAMQRWVPGGWYIVGAGLAAGLVGAWRHGR